MLLALKPVLESSPALGIWSLALTTDSKFYLPHGAFNLSHFAANCQVEPLRVIVWHLARHASFEPVEFIHTKVRTW